MTGRGIERSCIHGLAAAAALLVSACGGGGGGGGSAPAAVAADNGSQYGTPTSSQIRPGVEIESRHGQCTSNFIYVANSVDYYIGTAAHCFSEDTNSGIDPCSARTEAPGWQGISIENATRPGTLVYTSWHAMQQNVELPGSNPCVYNDFALVKIDPADVSNVHPAAIGFGGPVGLYTGIAPNNDTVYSYGRSPFHASINDLETKTGRIVALRGGGWSYRISADNPGLSGDSGSAVLHEDGRALAVLSDVGASAGTAPVTNGVVNLEMALDYAKSDNFIPADTRVETWPDFAPP